MKVRSDHRIDGCIAIEMACADIYRSLSERFPEAGTLWKELSGEEKNHAVSLIMAQGGNPEGELPDLEEHPSMPFIKEALERARTIKKRLAERDMTLEEALRLALELEESAVEGFFWDVFTGENDLQAVARLKRLIEKERSQGRKITLFMEERGIPHKSFRPDIPGD